MAVAFAFTASARAEVTGIIECSATAQPDSFTMCTFVVEPSVA